MASPPGREMLALEGGFGISPHAVLSWVEKAPRSRWGLPLPVLTWPTAGTAPPPSPGTLARSPSPAPLSCLGVHLCTQD